MPVIDILKDIAKIVKDDKEHFVKVVVDMFEVTVYLEYDPEKAYDEKCIIPIRYTTVEEYAFIPDDEYKEKYQPNDFGMDITEIKLVYEIMKYFESHKKEINELCSQYDWENRGAKDEG